VAFLPRSQVDIRPVRDVTPLMHMTQPFQILKMDKRRGNIVVSRRAVSKRAAPNSVRKWCRTSKKARWSKAWSRTSPITVRSSISAASTACCTSPTWPGARQPSVRVPVDRPDRQGPDHPHQPGNPAHQLGMKQLESDPWEGIEAKVPGRQARHRPRHQHHRLRCIRGAGAGHRRPDPRVRNELDQEERPSGQDRVDLARKSKWKCSRSTRPSAAFRSASSRPPTIRGKPSRRAIPAGTNVEGEIKNITEFGLFIGLEGDVDGMVHLSDLDWNRPGEEAIEDYNKGDVVKAIVLDVDQSTRSASRSASSSLAARSAKRVSGELRKGATVVTCEVTEVQENGLEVKVCDTDDDRLHPPLRPGA
jgi:small subunit ribosomal protein S1